MKILLRIRHTHKVAALSPPDAAATDHHHHHADADPEGNPNGRAVSHHWTSKKTQNKFMQLQITARRSSWARSGRKLPRWSQSNGHLKV
jgi:hypothetical protein